MSKSLLSWLSQTEVWVGALGLAAFLTVFWVLRGAPVGQAVSPEDDEDAPRGGYRDRVVAAVALGMLLILAGAYLAFTRGAAWSIPAFALGFGTVLALVMINQRYRHASPTLRRTVDVSTTALNASLFAGVLIVVNVIAFRYGGRALDMTRERAFSLSTLSVAQVKSLKRPVTFTTFFGRGAVAAQQYERVRELLELFKAVNPEQVTIDHVDPYRDLPRYEDLVKRVPDVGVTQGLGGGVVIEYGEGESADRAVVRNVDLFDVPQDVRFNPNVEQFRSNFKGEDAVTSALIRLRESKKPKVVFTTGHGEPPVHEMGEPEPRGPRALEGAAHRDGLGRPRGQPADRGDPAPTRRSSWSSRRRRRSSPTRSARLKRYADRKGPLLVVAGDDEPTGLEGLLKRFNVEFGKGIIIEQPRLRANRAADALLIPVQNAQHSDPGVAQQRDRCSSSARHP